MQYIAVSGPRPPFAHCDPLMRMSDPKSPGRDAGVLTKTRAKTQRPPLYKVLLLNDDYTPMEFVVHVLERFFGIGQAPSDQVPAPGSPKSHRYSRSVNASTSGDGLLLGLASNRIAQGATHWLRDGSIRASMPVPAATVPGDAQTQAAARTSAGGKAGRRGGVRKVGRVDTGWPVDAKGAVYHSEAPMGTVRSGPARSVPAGIGTNGVWAQPAPACLGCSRALPGHDANR